MSADIQTWDLSDTTRVAVAIAYDGRDMFELGLDQDPFVAAIAEALEVEIEQVESAELKHPNCEGAPYPGWRIETNVPPDEVVFRVRAALSPVIHAFLEQEGERAGMSVMIEVAESVRFIQAGPLGVLEAIAWAARDAGQAP